MKKTITHGVSDYQDSHYKKYTNRLNTVNRDNNLKLQFTWSELLDCWNNKFNQNG